MIDRDNLSRITHWLSVCLLDKTYELRDASAIRNKPEREVWDCVLEYNGASIDAVISIYKHDSLESVNTNLPPAQAVQKCVLAMTELPAFGIPTPQVMGHGIDGTEAAVIYRRIDRTAWEPQARIQAAGILAKLHSLEECRLSEQLQHLVCISDPREERTTGGCGPTASTSTLVHGDYFSANILPTVGGYASLTGKHSEMAIQCGTWGF